MRVCCSKNIPQYKVTYHGGIMNDDVILVCSFHIGTHPFDKAIKKKEELN